MISFIVSAPLPPVAGISFSHATEFVTVLNKSPSASVNELTSFSYSMLVICFISPFLTFELIPPPTKYLTVTVVFVGDCPYDLVFPLSLLEKSINYIEIL